MALALRWQGVAIAVALFAALWETRDHIVPATTEEWKDLLVNAVTPSEQVIQYGIHLNDSFHDVMKSSIPFLTALCKLVYLALRPVVLGVYALLLKACYGFYEFVIIRLICSPTTLRNIKYFVQTAIRWQMNRTKREVALEVAILSSVVGMYFFIRFLNRRRYLERSKRWIRRKRRQLHMVCKVDCLIRDLGLTNVFCVPFQSNTTTTAIQSVPAKPCGCKSNTGYHGSSLPLCIRYLRL